MEASPPLGANEPIRSPIGNPIDGPATGSNKPAPLPDANGNRDIRDWLIGRPPPQPPNIVHDAINEPATNVRMFARQFPLSASLAHRWRNGIPIWPKCVTSVGRPIRPTNIVEISRMIEQLERANIIERCKRGTFLSYPFLRLKANGAARLIINYSHLTNKLNTPHYSAKSIFQLLHTKYWPRGLYYCKIDLQHAFYNLELKEDARFITTFKWEGKHYRFKRMPFGICIAPFYMQMFYMQIAAIPNAVGY
jgi:hypothetical protein